MSLKWNGDKVLSRMTRAEVKGVNETMQATATHAKQNHEWISRSFPGLETSIGIATFARVKIRGVSGIWGSSDIAYALVHELGSAAGSGQNIPARPYLRPAADVEYPALAGNIRKAFKRAA